MRTRPSSRRSGRHIPLGLSAVGPTEAEVPFLQAVMEEVKEVVLLQKASKETLAKVANAMVKVKAPAGSAVVNQGELSDAMYIIADGEAIVQLAKAGNEAPLTKLQMRGAYFGAMSLLGNTPQKTTVVAQSDLELFRLDRAAFDSIILSQSEEKEGASEEEEEEKEVPPCGTSDLKEIFIVSDSTGESATASVQTAMRQFDYCFNATCGSSRTTVYRFVRTAEEAKRIASLAKERDALLVHTVMEPKVHEALTSACRDLKLECCDLWGALLENLEKKFGAKRSGVNGRRQRVDDQYMKIVKAIEYTRKVDDGVLPHLWNECDIMLIGPSRAGKTPLAFYLSQRGFKVANYPLVPDEEPPKELFQIDQNKCFALMIQPEKLQAIRTERMKQFGRSGTAYGAIDNIKKEVAWIKTFYLRHGSKWPIIDTSNAGVVETAARILEILDRRKGDSIDASVLAEH